MDRSDLEKLSKQALVDLVLKLQRQAKTSRTSSKPPSMDRKARRAHAKPGGAKPGHEGHNRALHENPDEIVEHRPDTCPQCHGQPGDDLTGDVVGEYDAIELPPIAPFVVRHRRLCVSCPHCSSKVKAPLPAAAHGSPFGPRLHGLALYLKTFHAVSFARLEGLLADLFGVKVSQGALANMLKRSHMPFADQKSDIIADLRRSDVVASDETGIRIEGLNGYHWVFMSRQAIVHEAQLSRAATVVRDVAYAVEASDDMVSLRLKLWLDRVFQLASNLTRFAARTVRAKRQKLENTLSDILASNPQCEIAETIRAKLARASPHLLTFLDHPGEVEITNNGCERALRPAVIQRKVTNGFCSMWAAQGDCAVRTVVDTAKLNGASPFQTLLATLN